MLLLGAVAVAVADSLTRLGTAERHGWNRWAWTAAPLAGVAVSLAALALAARGAHHRVVAGADDEHPLWTARWAGRMLAGAGCAALAVLAGLSAFGWFAAGMAAGSAVPGPFAAGYALIIAAALVPRRPRVCTGLLAAGTLALATVLTWPPHEWPDGGERLYNPSTSERPFIAALTLLAVATTLAIAALRVGHAAGTPWAGWSTSRVALVAVVTAGCAIPLSQALSLPLSWSAPSSWWKAQGTGEWSRARWNGTEESLAVWVLVPLAVLLVFAVPVAVTAGRRAAGAAVACFAVAAITCQLVTGLPARPMEISILTGAAVLGLLGTRALLSRSNAQVPDPDVPAAATGR